MALCRVLKAFAFLLSFLAIPWAIADPLALILIRHDSAGPNLPTADFIHPYWIRWPIEAPENSGNRWLSIMSGWDWKGDPDDLRFEPQGEGKWESHGWKNLDQRGYFKARKSFLRGLEIELVTSAMGVAGASTLLLDLRGETAMVVTRPLRLPLPKRGLMLYEAQGWDDAQWLVSKNPGRSLIVEVPYEHGFTWSRFWIPGNRWRGKGWAPLQTEIGVPGLIPARQIVDLLRSPDSFQWTLDRSKTWGGPNRWLLHEIWIGRAWRALAFLAAVAVAVLGFVAIQAERSSSAVPLALRSVLLLPAADVLAGNICFGTGLENWPIWFLLSAVSCLAFSWVIGHVLQACGNQFSPLLPVGIVGSVLFVALNPVWSDLGGAFRSDNLPASADGCGALVGYLAMAGGFAGDLRKGLKGLMAVGILGITAASVLANPWWVNGNPTLAVLPVVAGGAGLSLVRVQTLFLLAVMPPAVIGLPRSTCWTQDGLLVNLADAKSYDLSRVVLFIASPGFLLSLGLVTLAFTLGNRFWLHQVRGALIKDRGSVSVLMASVGVVAVSLFQPWLLGAAFICAVGGSLVLIHETLAGPAGIRV